MAKVKSDGHIWGLKFNRYVCFSFRGNWIIFGRDVVNSIGHGQGQILWSHLRLRVFNLYVCFLFRGNRTMLGWDIVNSIYDLENSRSRSEPRSNPMVTFEASISIDMFVFCFVAIRPFLAEIERIPYLTLKIQGQGHDQNRSKSNQVIYRSGPSILPKLKEIWKVVQKLSHEQNCGGQRQTECLLTNLLSYIGLC